MVMTPADMGRGLGTAHQQISEKEFTAATSPWVYFLEEGSFNALVYLYQLHNKNDEISSEYPIPPHFDKLIVNIYLKEMESARDDLMGKMRDVHILLTKKKNRRGRDHGPGPHSKQVSPAETGVATMMDDIMNSKGMDSSFFRISQIFNYFEMVGYLHMDAAIMNLLADNEKADEWIQNTRLKVMHLISSTSLSGSIMDSMSNVIAKLGVDNAELDISALHRLTKEICNKLDYYAKQFNRVNTPLAKVESDSLHYYINSCIYLLKSLKDTIDRASTFSDYPGQVSSEICSQMEKVLEVMILLDRRLGG
jgi:hypothetical protein